MIMGEILNYKEGILRIRHINLYNIFAIVLCIMLLWFFSNYGISYIPKSGVSDQIYYESLYNSGNQNTYFEIGYLILCEMGTLAGLTYQQFKTILAIVAVFLIFKRLKNNGIDYLFLLFLYILTSFPYDLEQSRMFFSQSIVIYATQYLGEYSKKNVVRYILLIVLATTIHTASLLYLLFIIFFLKNKKIIILSLEFVSLLLCCFGLITGNDFSLIGKILYAIIPNKRILFWFSYSTNLGYLEIWFFYFVMLLMLKYIVNNMGEVIGERKKFIFDVYRMLRILCVILPLGMITTDFNRIIRNFFLFFFSAVLVGTNVLMKEKCVTDLEKVRLFLIMRGSMVLISFIFLVLYGGAAERVLSAFY